MCRGRPSSGCTGSERRVRRPGAVEPQRCRGIRARPMQGRPLARQLNRASLLGGTACGLPKVPQHTGREAAYVVGRDVPVAETRPPAVLHPCKVVSWASPFRSAAWGVTGDALAFGTARLEAKSAWCMPSMAITFIGKSNRARRVCDDLAACKYHGWARGRVFV